MLPQGPQRDTAADPVARYPCDKGPPHHYAQRLESMFGRPKEGLLRRAVQGARKIRAVTVAAHAPAVKETRAPLTVPAGQTVRAAVPTRPLALTPLVAPTAQAAPRGPGPGPRAWGLGPGPGPRVLGPGPGRRDAGGSSISR